MKLLGAGKTDVPVTVSALIAGHRDKGAVLTVDYLDSPDGKAAVQSQTPGPWLPPRNTVSACVIAMSFQLRPDRAEFSRE